MSRRGVDAWRREVYQSPLITNATRVLLLLMAEHMDQNRKVCEKRADLARMLDRHPQRVAERVAAAVSAGLLDCVSPGYKGHTAVYQGLFPDPVGAAKRTDPEYAKSRPDRYAITGVCVPDGEYTTTTADPSERGTDRNVGNDEKSAPPSPIVHPSETVSRERRATA